ncbi:MAG: glycosyltransferase family 39 protein [Myxococcales bacterium]|nr:glycosyltransferase family 39 protein [Myxococcales bacterium]
MIERDRSRVVFALCVFALHLAIIGLYGYHRDELYLLACGRHLEWGSVDHAPLTPAISNVLALVFGESPVTQRLFAAFAGAVVVWITGTITKALGGSRHAQLLAMGSVAIAPAFIYSSGVNTTNALDQLVWAAASYFVLVPATPRRWLVLGIVLGIGLLAKYTILMFGLALGVGLVATARDQLRTPWPYAAAAIALAIWLPNLDWQAAHGFPALTFLRDHHAARAQSESLAALFYQQPIIIGPLSFAVACCGLRPALRAHPTFAVMVVVVVAVLIVQHGKPYYLAPIYPGLIAIGSIAVAVKVRRWWLVCTAWATGGVIAIVATLPVLPAQTAYELGLYRTNAEFVQFADWRGVARQISTADRDAHATAILTDSYGTAAAVEAFGPELRLPAVISGANSYYLWTAEAPDPDDLIAIGYSLEILQGRYREVTVVGSVQGPFGLDNRFDFPRRIYHCRGARGSLHALWPLLRRFD